MKKPSHITDRWCRVALVLAMLTPVTMVAQKSHTRQLMAVGVTYNYATEYHQHGIGAKLQLGIDSHWRIEPEMVYFAQSRDVTTLQLNVNVHYVQHVAGPLALYPFVGMTYSHWGYDGPNVNRWGANLGAGLELSLGRRWVALGEARFMLVKQETQAITTLGIKHLF